MEVHLELEFEKLQSQEVQLKLKHFRKDWGEQTPQDRFYFQALNQWRRFLMLLRSSAAKDWSCSKNMSVKM